MGKKKGYLAKLNKLPKVAQLLGKKGEMWIK